MYAFSSSGAITQYTDPRQVIVEFVGVRRALYVQRKQREEALLRAQLHRQRNQARFLDLIAEGSFVFGGKSKSELEDELALLGFMDQQALNAPLRALGLKRDGKGAGDTEDGQEEGTEEVEGRGGRSAEVEAATAAMLGGDGEKQNKPGTRGGGGSGKFGYLLSLPLWSASMERRTGLRAQAADVETALKDLERKTAEDIWLSELHALRGALASFLTLP